MRNALPSIRFNEFPFSLSLSLFKYLLRRPCIFIIVTNRLVLILGPMRTSDFRKDGNAAETRGGTRSATISFKSDSTLYGKEVARYSERKEEISEDGTTPSLLRLVQSSSFALSNV